ncbi:hypothetical protein [Actinotalea sp. JY-7885]|uniref:hypothetical protein n=1 Tax=Actinotalea sp. JY-7885 TaxID=2758576 RepID=UPI00165E4ABD|nr:hypothetical protein [Actinotalea sp. JY-7885]
MIKLQSTGQDVVQGTLGPAEIVSIDRPVAADGKTALRCCAAGPCREHRELTERLPERPVTLPAAHETVYVEHGRGHALAEWAHNRWGNWVVRADAGYVLGRVAAGEATINVTTRRGRVQTVTIAHVGKPFVTARGGHKLVYVTPVEADLPVKRRRTPTRPSGPNTPPIPEGALPCDACGALRTTRFPTVDRHGVAGLVCVRCDASEAAARTIFGGPLEQGELDLHAAA